MATVRVLEATGARVIVPPHQHCCGLPALDAGDLPTARRMARQTIAALDAADARAIVTPGASCAIAIRHEYTTLFEDEPHWQVRAHALGERVYDLATYLSRVVPLPVNVSWRPNLPSATASGPSETVTYHPFCQSLNVLGLDAEPRAIVEALPGVELRPLPEANVCCGFGGSASLEHPAVARAIVARKLANVADTGASTLVTDNPGCLLHLRGAVDAAGLPLRVVHLAELIAERLA
jgi:Fe-S oxidoreductase